MSINSILHSYIYIYIYTHTDIYIFWLYYMVKPGVKYYKKTHTLDKSGSLRYKLTPSMSLDYYIRPYVTTRTVCVAHAHSNTQSHTRTYTHVCAHTHTCSNPINCRITSHYITIQTYYWIRCIIDHRYAITSVIEWMYTITYTSI